MEIIYNPVPEAWADLCRRCENDSDRIESTVCSILNNVKERGDSALADIALRVDGFVPEQWEVDEASIELASSEVSPNLKKAIDLAIQNIASFHKAQMPSTVEVETMPGVKCMQRPMAIRRVGLYIPGGKAPLFSTVLMLAVPARIAGCREVILCTPPGPSGRINPAILYASRAAGVDRIFAIGGAQAIAAMAFGTESVPRVDKIFGPGNRYVTMAKQMVGGKYVSIDMPAGPSEVMVLADSTADPAFVASDLLSQAEHGEDSQAILVALDRDIVDPTLSELERQIARLPRREIAKRALSNSRIVVFDKEDSRQRAIDFANEYAPEHLILSIGEPLPTAEEITAAGSVFIGNYSPESVGDYASGTNHTLPTGGWARSCSGVNLDSFMRKITFQQLTREGLSSLSEAVIAMAEAEGLEGHANAVRIRTKGGWR